MFDPETTKAFLTYLDRLKQNQPEKCAKLDLENTIALYEHFKDNWNLMTPEDRQNFWNLPAPEVEEWKSGGYFPPPDHYENRFNL